MYHDPQIVGLLEYWHTDILSFQKLLNKIFYNMLIIMAPSGHFEKHFTVNISQNESLSWISVAFTLSQEFEWTRLEKINPESKRNWICPHHRLHGKGKRSEKTKTAVRILTVVNAQNTTVWLIIENKTIEAGKITILIFLLILNTLFGTKRQKNKIS